MVRRGWALGKATEFERAAACVLGLVLLTACSTTDVSPTTTAAADWAARSGPAVLASAVVSVGLGADPDGARAIANFRLTTALRGSEPASAAWLGRMALAHALADELAAGAQAQGPITDAELESWTTAHWLGVDRPQAFRTTHVVVVVAEKASEADRATARTLAEQIRAVVADAASLDEFRAKATAVPAGGATVKVEDLEPVVADGRVVRLGAKIGVPPGNYDESFARAACALRQIGETSPVITSSFGFHVLRLVEIVPELRFGVDERRSMATRDVYDMRARKQLNELIATARKQASASVERSAEEATARVSVE